MKGAQEEQGIIFFSTENETKIINWEQDFCAPQSIISS